MPHGACFTTGGTECATLWRPPDQWHIPFWQYLVNGPELLGIFGTGALNVMSTMDRVEKLHPKQSHWYLQVIGTDPPKQGKGFAGDRHARAACGGGCERHALLSGIEQGHQHPRLSRFGFEVTGEIKIPDGPTLWPMWRAPRAV